MKNLSINLKKYDLNPSILGGDVVSGSDIGNISIYLYVHRFIFIYIFLSLYLFVTFGRLKIYRHITFEKANGGFSFLFPLIPAIL